MSAATAPRRKHAARKPAARHEPRPKPASPLDDYILREDWALASGRSIRSLKRDAILGRGAKPFLYGKKVYYSRAAIAEHLAGLAAERNGGSS